jgi:hypothetical protein
LPREDNDVERRTPSGSASAWGIKTGTGDDRIVIGEQGSLQVKALGQAATAMAGLNAVGIDAGAGSNHLDILGAADRQRQDCPHAAEGHATGHPGRERAMTVRNRTELTVDACRRPPWCSGKHDVRHGIDAGAGTTGWTSWTARGHRPACPDASPCPGRPLPQRRRGDDRVTVERAG